MANKRHIFKRPTGLFLPSFSVTARVSLCRILSHVLPSPPWNTLFSMHSTPTPGSQDVLVSCWEIFPALKLQHPFLSFTQCLFTRCHQCQSFHSLFTHTFHLESWPVFCRGLQLLNAPLSLVFLYLYSSQSSDLSGFLPQLEHVTFLIFCWSVGFGIGSYISSGEGEAAVPKIPLKRLYLLSHITALREAVGGSSTPHGYLRTSGFSILLLHSSWLMVKAKSSAHRTLGFELMGQKERKNVFCSVW